jgi:hypothetical protein
VASRYRRLISLQCEKHSKKEEALAKLREGVKFDEVAREFSQDKARQGKFCIRCRGYFYHLVLTLSYKEGRLAGKQEAVCTG